MPPRDNRIADGGWIIHDLNPYMSFDRGVITTVASAQGSGGSPMSMNEALARQDLRAWARSSGTPFDAFVPPKKKKSTIDLDTITKKNVEVFKKVDTLRKDMTKLHVDFVREHVENKEMCDLIFLISRMQKKLVTDKVIESLANDFRPALKEIRYRYKTKDHFVEFFIAFFRNRVIIDDNTLITINSLVEDLWYFNSIVANVETELDKLTGKTKIKRTVCEDYLPNNTSRYEIETGDDLF